MNILLFSQFFSTTKGGGEYVFKTIAESLEKKGNKVWVITSKTKGELYQETDNLKIITTNPELEYRGGLPPSFSDNIRYVINAFREGKRIIKKNHIDLIHSNNFSPALAGSVLSYFTKIPHITTIHDIFSIYDKDFWKKWASQSGTSYTNARLVPFFEKIMMKFKINCIHTVSDATKKDIQKIGTIKPIHVIPNCLKEELPLNIQPRDKQFIYLGRLIFYKNIEVVLRAIKIVSEQFPDVKLIIAGDGPHKQSLQIITQNLKIESNVTFVGYVSPDHKNKLLAESNALLFPSTIEGFGLVILESFQQKRPVITSDIPPMSDIIQDKETGFVIDPFDEKDWAEKIIMLIKDVSLSDKMGQSGSQVLKTKYSQKLFYERLMVMYNSITEKIS